WCHKLYRAPSSTNSCWTPRTSQGRVLITIDTDFGSPNFGNYQKQSKLSPITGHSCCIAFRLRKRFFYTIPARSLQRHHHRRRRQNSHTAAEVTTCCFPFDCLTTRVARLHLQAPVLDFPLAVFRVIGQLRIGPARDR